MNESGAVRQRRVCSTPASTIRAAAGAFEELSELLTDPEDAVRLRWIVGWLTGFADCLPPEDGGPGLERPR